MSVRNGSRNLNTKTNITTIKNQRPPFKISLTNHFRRMWLVNHRRERRLWRTKTIRKITATFYRTRRQLVFFAGRFLRHERSKTEVRRETRYFGVPSRSEQLQTGQNPPIIIVRNAELPPCLRKYVRYFSYRCTKSTTAFYSFRTPPTCNAMPD